MGLFKILKQAVTFGPKQDWRDDPLDRWFARAILIFGFIAVPLLLWAAWVMIDSMWRYGWL